MMYRVQHPIVSSHITPGGTATIVPIPIGGMLEVGEEPGRVGLIQVIWNGKRVRIFAMDLFDCAEPVAPT
jgi:hypothetical protein